MCKNGEGPLSRIFQTKWMKCRLDRSVWRINEIVARKGLWQCFEQRSVVGTGAVVVGGRIRKARNCVRMGTGVQ